MNSNLKIILVVGTLFLGVILTFLLLNRLWNNKNPEAFVRKQTGIAEEQWVRVLQSSKIEDGEIVKNIYDAYQIKIPEIWMAPKQTTFILNIYMRAELQNRFIEEELKNITTWPVLEHATSMFRIYTLANKEKLDIKKFINSSQKIGVTNIPMQDLLFQETKINDVISLKSSRQVYNSEGGETKNTQYIFAGTNNDRVYIIVCSTNIDQCEEVIKTFEILD